MATGARLLTIPTGAPFLRTLVDGLMDGTILPDFRGADEPFGLADLTLVLPTRRAVRVLGQRIAERAGGRPVLMPRVIALGDPDPDDGDSLADPALLALPPAMEAMERRLAFAGLVRAFRQAALPGDLKTPAGVPIRIPASAADALRLAADLLALVDQGHVEGVDWSGLDGLVPDSYADWWRLTLHFLKIAVAEWPRHLAEAGLADPAARRTAVLDALAARIASGAIRGPIVVAGSTGSQPATARLLSAVACHPRGAVVLPGFDLTLSGADFRMVAEGQSPTHPQTAMARLVGVHMRLDPGAVVAIGSVPADLRRRGQIVAQALRPAASTDLWLPFLASLAREDVDAACAGITVVEAANEAEEALAVAIALREAVEDPDATAALVTPDRTLARRVSAELARFGIEAEDSAGEPLNRTPAGVLLLLVARVAMSGADPVALAGLLKHPLARFGLPPAEARRAARTLELLALRGPRLAPGLAAVVEAADADHRLTAEGRRSHAARERLAEADVAAARDLARRVAAALAGLEALCPEPVTPLSAWIPALARAIDAVTEPPPGEERAPPRPAEQAVADLFDGVVAATRAPDLPVSPGELERALAALMDGIVVRPPPRGGRVHIWGPLEARLMSVDRLVLGGLVETVWPPAPDTGPWLSRPMRTSLGFPVPETRIGLSAHDFAEALGTRDVVLTRAMRRGGSPSVPARFLKRLEGLVGGQTFGGLVERGRRLAGLARLLDDRPRQPRAPRPEPKPPLPARPTSLTFTEIARWIRDPYAIYARRVLDLEPLPPLGELPHFGTRGSVMHAALAEFARSYTGPMDEAAVAALLAIGERHFQALRRHPDLHGQWWPRFRNAAGFLVRRFEAERVAVIRHAEVKGALAIAGTPPFTLRGRADRIDRWPDGRVSVVDFKSGSVPTSRQIATAREPQLALEALVAMAGGFEGIEAASIRDLVHVEVKGVAGRDAVHVFAGHHGRAENLSLAETLERTRRRLEDLVTAYRDPDRGYLSRANPLRTSDKGDFDHLARVAEWSLGADSGGEEGE